MAYKYCVAENWGKGFIEHQESVNIDFRGLPGNVWRLPINNKHANLWVAKVEAVYKTKEEAQAIVDTVVSAAQAEYDAYDEEVKRINNRPENIILE